MLLTVSGWAQTVRPVADEVIGHVVKEGEDLFDIAFSNRLAVDHLAYANGFPITTMKAKPGTKVIVPFARVLPSNPPRNGLIVNLPERGVYCFRNGQYDGFYPISIGDEIEQKGRFWTRWGSYAVIEKIKNPTWYPPSWSEIKGPIGPGPDNPLGDRWIGLSLQRTGFHGTNDPYNIGNSVTHGCMRMYPENVRELYEKVAVGWPVRIEYETAKLGRGRDGRIYVVTFKDVYKKSNPVQAAHALLQKAGLEGHIGRKNFDSILDLGLGFPVSVEGTEPVFDELNKRVSWK
ncbi:MAG: L,D-transpeptidase family protein [Candidatus Eremiobacteraeota bacterium]|nr:L,D-transpeptidase family protein [Candidatus Eremiobacteraeota bacterium]